MSMKLMVEALHLKLGNPLRKLVLIKMADNANDDGICWPSYKNIADACEISRSAVKNHVRALESAGYVERTERRNGTRSSSNVYRITLPRVSDTPGHEIPRATDDRGYDLPAPRASDDRAPGHEMTPPRASDDPRTSHRNQSEGTSHGTGERKRASKATPIPEGFEPDDKLLQWAQANTPAVDPRAEVGKFVDYHRAKGNTFKDHRAAFRTWLRKAQEFREQRQPAKGEEAVWDIAD